METRWQSVGSLLRLTAEDIQIWRIDLADAAGLVDRYTSRLTTEEQRRAERYRADHVRKQFVIGRVCLRTLLGNAMGVSSEQVPITESAHGKPEIAIIQDRPVFFNVAHSKNMILVALRRRGVVGIDVEYIDPAIDVMEIARSALHKNELYHLAQIAEPERRRAFFRCWTRKEAVAKADGRGLSLSLSSFEVPIFDAHVTPVRVDGPIGDAGNCYFVSDISAGNQFAAAIALDTADCSFRMLTFPLSSLE